MAHHLNTNKQFMVGNGLLAFAVIIVVVLFVYISMKMQQDKKSERNYVETYVVTLERGFVGDSLSLFVNDSLVMNSLIKVEPALVEIKRFAKQSALMIVDNRTQKVSTFDLSEKGGKYRFEKEDGAIKQLAQE
nr:hypothetical protein [uncultured Bacteroides sp.]